MALQAVQRLQKDYRALLKVRSPSKDSAAPRFTL